MKCPNCIAVDLLMSERQGIEIDYCPSCRGVWLDRGELDRFIERAEIQSRPTQRRTISTDDSDNFDDMDDRDRQRDKPRGEIAPSFEDRSDQRVTKKKESFWSNLFDFD